MYLTTACIYECYKWMIKKANSTYSFVFLTENRDYIANLISPLTGHKGFYSEQQTYVLDLRQVT